MTEKNPQGIAAQIVRDFGGYKRDCYMRRMLVEAIASALSEAHAVSRQDLEVGGKDGRSERAPETSAAGRIAPPDAGAGGDTAVPEVLTQVGREDRASGPVHDGADLSLVRRVAELEAALAESERLRVQAAQEGWQPIATAPPWEVVLLYRPNLPERERIAPRRAHDWCGPACCPNANPTHWMPLPNPPKGDDTTTKTLHDGTSGASSTDVATAPTDLKGSEQ